MDLKLSQEPLTAFMGICDGLAPKGWAGINWLETSDTAIAMARAKAKLSGCTRERVRQVRAQIAKGLRASPAHSQLLRSLVVGLHLESEKERAMLRGLSDLQPVTWHKAIKNPPSTDRILALEPGEVAGMTAYQVAKKVRCQEQWAATVLRENGLVFRDIAKSRGTKYPWQSIAPLEWYLLSDAELAAKVGCSNVSVVAQYRDRHGGISKYHNPGLTIVRRYLMGHSAKRRLAVVRGFVNGDMAPLRDAVSKECRLLDPKIKRAERLLRTSVRIQGQMADRVARLQKASAPGASKKLRVAIRRLDDTDHRVSVGVARLDKWRVASRLPEEALAQALKEFVVAMRGAFPTVAEWFPGVPKSVVVKSMVKDPVHRTDPVRTDPADAVDPVGRPVKVSVDA